MIENTTSESAPIVAFITVGEAAETFVGPTTGFPTKRNFAYDSGTGPIATEVESSVIRLEATRLQLARAFMMSLFRISWALKLDYRIELHHASRRPQEGEGERRGPFAPGLSSGYSDRELSPGTDAALGHIRIYMMAVAVCSCTSFPFRSERRNDKPRATTKNALVTAVDDRRSLKGDGPSSCMSSPGDEL